MRAIVLATFLAGTVAGCNPYDPNLPPMPFRCGSTDPICPSGYACGAGNLCVEDDGGPDGGRPDGDDCVNLAEPNDMINQATLGPVFESNDYIQYEGLTLCPAMDTDMFRVVQPLVSPVPNIHVLVEFEDLGAPPTVAVLNSTGTVVSPGGPTGNQGEVGVSFSNVAQGQYYVRVTAQAILPHYKLTICDITSTDPPCPF